MLKKAEEQEGKYEWTCAARSHKKTLRSGSITCSFAAATWEKIGFCYGRASRQTEDVRKFKKLGQLAVEAYKNAAKLFEREDNPQSLGKSARCNTLAEYTRSWLVSSPLEKRKALDGCRTIGRESLKAYKDAGDELSYGKMCNDLVLCLLDWFHVASDSAEMQSIALEGIDCANKAIGALSKLGSKPELLQAYSMASLQTWYAANISEPEDKEELVRRSLECSEKAMEFSRMVDDPYCVAMANWAAALCTAFFTGKAESSLLYAKKVMEQGMIAKDNYLKGVASYLLALTTNWIVLKEEDPDRKKVGYEEIIRYAEDAIHYLQPVSQDLLIAETYLYYAESCSALARDPGAGSADKLALLEKAVETGRKGLDHAVRSGSPDATGSTLHALSKALHFYSNLKTDEDERKTLLEEALTYRKEYCDIVERVFKSNSWIRGVGKNYEGLIKAELARVESEESKKRDLLESAASTIEEAVSQCRKSIAALPVPALVTATAGFEDAFAGILEESYFLNGDGRKLEKAIQIHGEAAKKFKTANMPSRAAESYWKIARNQDRLEMHREAAENFQNAFGEYTVAAGRIDHLREFYLDYATYMKAWSETEKAKLAHKNDDYATAMIHYEETANLLKSSKSWNYLSSTFLAWSHLDRAEDLSRKGRTVESIEQFRKATETFGEARQVLRTELSKIRDADEKDLAEKLTETSDLREEYCLGRIALEEAKVLDRQGDHSSSSRKYGAATERFQRAIDVAGQELDRRDLKPLACLCRAWQMMTRAEAEASPELYLEASRHFDEAKEHSFNEKAKLLALGHSCFCRALEAGSKFEATRDTASHMEATHHLESAANYYLKAGVENASEYAKATQRLFDAYVYMDKAKKELDPEKKTRYYMMAEKVLKTSASSYSKAEHSEKKEEVRRLLESVKEERQLAKSLVKVMRAPTVAASTESFSVPAPTHEEAVGLERFKHPFVEARLMTSDEVTVGDELDVRLDLVNVAKTSGLLVRIEDLIPSAFKVAALPSQYSLKDSSIDMKGRPLEPLKVESIKLTVLATEVGTFSLSPQVIYVDEVGEFRTSRPRPVSIAVGPKLTFEFKTENATSAFNYLISAFVEDYMKRRISLEKSGWRTLMDIMKNAKVSRSSVYAASGARGKAISELERRGLVEARVFPGERGRGGKIVKMRIYYEKETVKRCVDQHIMKK
jgi:hypothetical protein